MDRSLLTCWSDSLTGKVGFSFTSTNIYATAKALYKYTNKYNLDAVYIGYDNRFLSRDFSNYLADSLTNMGISVIMLDRPSPIFLLSWLSTQTSNNKTSVGVYLGGDDGGLSQMNLSFRNSDGSPFTYEQTKELYKEYTFELRSTIDYKDRKKGIDYVDVSEGYAKWLVDTIKPKVAVNPHVGIDYLTSPMKQYLRPLFKILGYSYKEIPEEFWHTPLVTNTLRPTPFGPFLSYPYKKLNIFDTVNFSFDGDGDCIGIFDGKKQEALSPSATFILLLYYLSKIKKRKGTILISRAVSDKVSIIAKAYGFAVEYVDGELSGLSGKLKEKRKRPALLYGDEKGGFWFKGMPLDRQPLIAILYILEVLEKVSLSPGELYDKIVEELLERDYTFAKLDLDPKEINHAELVKLLENKDGKIAEQLVVGVEKGNIQQTPGSTLFEPVEFRLEDQTRIVMQSNAKNSLIELYVEGINKDSINDVIQDIQVSLYTDDTV